MKPCLSNPRLAALPLAGLFTSAALLETPDPLPRGHAYFQADFEGTNALQGWNGAGRVEGGHPTGQALIVESEPGRTPPTSLVSVVLPAEAMRGYLVRGSARVRAEDAGSPPNSWNGIKCMLAIETPDRKLIRRDKVTGRNSFAFSAAKGDYTITCTAQGYAPHEAPLTVVPQIANHLKIRLAK